MSGRHHGAEAIIGVETIGIAVADAFFAKMAFDEGVGLFLQPIEAASVAIDRQETNGSDCPATTP